MTRVQWERGLGGLGRWLCCLVVLGFLGATAHATTMIYADVERLTEISSLIVEGEIIGQRTFRVEEGGIFTEWTLEVSELHKGEAGATVRFQQWGGMIDDEFTYIPGDARFQVGERVMVFLHADEEGMHWLSALGQSKFLIGGGAPPTGPVVPLDQALERGLILDQSRIRPVELPRIETSQVPLAVMRDLRSLSFYDDERSGEPVFHFDSVEVMRHSELVERVRRAVGADVAR